MSGQRCIWTLTPLQEACSPWRPSVGCPENGFLFWSRIQRIGLERMICMEYYSNNCNYIQYIDSCSTCRMSRCFVAKLSTAYEYKEVNSNSLSIVRQLACLEDATFGIDILVCNKSRRCFKIWSHIYIYTYDDYNIYIYIHNYMWLPG